MRRMIIWQACICVMLSFMSMNAGPTDEEAQNSKQIQEILRQDRGGIFRGMHFNMSVEKVSQIEESENELKAEDGRLTYAIKESNSATSERIDVYYEFEDQGLTDITVNSVQKDFESAIKLYRGLRDHFDMVYGEGNSTQNGKTTWTGMDRETGLSFNVVCELKDLDVVITYYSL